MNIKSVRIALLMQVIFAGLPLCAQDIPIVIEGVLKSSEGTALPEGFYSLTFRLYLSNDGDAQPLWSETQSNVALKDGVYRIVLGSVNPIRLAFDRPYFLGVSLGDQAEFIPRSELTAAPAALFASRGGGGTEPGMIAPFAGYLEKIPYGWFPCDGRALKSTEYPALFSIIGTTYGNGSSGMGAGGGTDFNVPNLNGQFLRGVDAGRFGSRPGLGVVQAASTAAPNTALNIGSAATAGQHSHNTISASHILHRDGSQPSGNSASQRIVGLISTTESGGGHSHTGTLGGGDQETRPRNLALIYCIKF
jgi:microcystin-dependent protein